MKKIFFLLPVIILVTTSCKKHLNREDAKKQITNTYGYPVVVDYDFPKEFTKDFINASELAIGTKREDDSVKEITNSLQRFENAGLIKFEEKREREEIPSLFFNRPSGFQTWTLVKVSLTDEGKAYLIKETNDKFKVKLWETDIVDISGVQEMEQEKRAKVDYTISNKNITPFGEKLSNKNKMTQKTIYFSLHDDGWRIQTN